MRDDFRRYLRAKRTVDDRALDRRLVGLLREQLAKRADAREGPLRVLEVGAGIGTMPARLLEWDVLPPGAVRYVALDVDADSVEFVEPYLRSWAADRQASVSGGGPIEIERAGRRVELEAIAAEAVAYAEQAAGRFDAVVGAALLDVLGVDGLETLLGALAPGGLCYFPITFDGGTRFRPGHPTDPEIERYYHEHMDAKPGGSSRAGGDVLERLRATDDARVLGAAGSDWVVRPVDGEYPADEAYFLRCILDTVEAAVDEVAGESFRVDLEGWLDRRREQLEAAELLYLTHQLDVLGRVDTPGR
ncbi:homolog to S-adenosylmethionine-dependent methyltransferase [Natronomonas moolapensis 8.8.11]|uniref:Homolog to S-adenosylmethionine-dependent methyltransferase n=1 Tax=Natronomonas moolapensis (strain DSM 18674 / CECT 7526 / JCM 14361 / 8.8.11) TaxID=268739 RepID=M1XNL1_NATM8|nr:hypothetical protein [Natronomonas moolapensis]CCQ35533.1 homolog to S-adenosylmethionine-dependent methyltransferase [Natronomonas moolapensis 8.8.11]